MENYITSLWVYTLDVIQGLCLSLGTPDPSEMLKSGIIPIVLISMIAAMPRPTEDLSRTTTISPSLLRTCSDHSHCHCMKGVPICYDNFCHCLYASSVENFENMPTNGTETLNETQQSDNPQ